MRFQCKYELGDYVEGYKAYAVCSSRRWLTRYLWAISIFLLLIGALGIRGPKGSVAAALPAILLGAFGLYYAATVWKRAGRRSFSGRPELTQESVVDAGDSGITFDGPISKMQWTWAAFVKFAETDKLFLAYLSPCSFIIFPKRMLTPGTADELRELLRQKLPVKQS
jgi:hypothetical protein